MKELPYYRLWVKDFDTNENVRVLDLAELGLYLSCLNHSWINEGLPADPTEIARALKVRQSQFEKLWKRVGRCFHLDGDRLVNSRQEEERAKAIAKSRQSSDAVAERERKRNERLSDDHPRALTRADSVCVSDSFLESKTRKEKPLRARGAVSQSFAAFWARWCELTKRRQRESYACQAWISVVEFETEAAAMACLERYGASGDVARGAIASPDKWIYDQARDKWEGDWPVAQTQKTAGIVGEMERYLDEH